MAQSKLAKESITLYKNHIMKAGSARFVTAKELKKEFSPKRLNVLKRLILTETIKFSGDIQNDTESWILSIIINTIQDYFDKKKPFNSKDGSPSIKLSSDQFKEGINITDVRNAIANLLLKSIDYVYLDPITGEECLTSTNLIESVIYNQNTNEVDIILNYQAFAVVLHCINLSKQISKIFSTKTLKANRI